MISRRPKNCQNNYGNGQISPKIEWENQVTNVITFNYDSVFIFERNFIKFEPIQFKNKPMVHNKAWVNS